MLAIKRFLETVKVKFLIRIAIVWTFSLLSIPLYFPEAIYNSLSYVSFSLLIPCFLSGFLSFLRKETWGYIFSLLVELFFVLFIPAFFSEFIVKALVQMVVGNYEETTIFQDYFFLGLYVFSWIFYAFFFIDFPIERSIKSTARKVYLTLKKTFSNAYHTFQTYWAKSYTLEQIEKRIKICKFFKYFGLVMTLLAGFFAFKSEDESLSKSTVYLTAFSGFAGMTSEAAKELILEPRLKSLELAKMEEKLEETINRVKKEFNQLLREAGNSY